MKNPSCGQPARIAASALALLVAAAVVGSASAQSGYVLIDSMTVSGMTPDGSVACGNTNDGLYEPCRWTAAEGMVRLGRAGTLVGLGSAGVPGISDDGNAVSSTIFTLADTLLTPGLWTKGVGWHECMPPLPPDGGVIEPAYGSNWGLSGDGLTVVGLYWRGGQPGGSAHALKWSAATGPVGLGSRTGSSRANGTNFDGSVVAGWSEAENGTWQPTVWDENGLTVLSYSDAMCQAQACNAVGDIIVGGSFSPDIAPQGRRVATMWKRNGAGWNEYVLGMLPGTFSNGNVWATDLTPHAGIVVGINYFDSFNSAGFVWTPQLGMMDAKAFFAENGVTLPADFAVLCVTAVSDDGLVYAGYGKNPLDWMDPSKGFIVTLAAVSGVEETPQAAGTALLGNRPNPFNPSTTIELALAADARVRVEVYDARGRLVRVVRDGFLPAGSHDLVWDGRDGNGRSVASGVYYARVRGDGISARPLAMTLLK